MKKLISTILAASIMAAGICSCQKAEPNNVTPEVKVTAESHLSTVGNIEIMSLAAEESQGYRSKYLKTSFDLLKEQMEGDENIMISPASIMLALSMAESGASGNTLAQMAALWGGEKDPNGQLSYASEILKRLNSSKGVSMHAADSMWINKKNLSEEIKAEYIDFVKKYYQSEVEHLFFDDKAIKKINKWVEDNTNGMIDKVIEDFSDANALLLINAIAFEGKWATQYEDYQVFEQTFKGTSGEQKVDFLHGTESAYLESSKATGFVKYYDGGQYAFVVMLPKDENRSGNDFLKDFSASDFDKYMSSLTNDYEVRTHMPEFKYDYSGDIVDSLKKLGMTDAFDDRADFTGIAQYPDDTYLFISKILHKTHIEVDRNGTKAAAVTAVTLDAAGAMPDESSIREVNCDRPFAYAIVDMTDNTPVFIGSVNEV